jgi:DNA-binding HxlR family transcriptional regulator/peroxiredoxin
MSRRITDPLCALSQATTIVGDSWSWLVVQEVARGQTRFDDLADALRISRKVLSERLRRLVDRGLLGRQQYHDGPPRFEYRLTDMGRALLPVLVALQDWGDQWVLGDGALSATSHDGAADVRRVRGLVGSPLPAVDLPHGDLVDADAEATVVFTYPATGAPSPLPDGWERLPGAVGCTLENRLFRDRFGEFAAAGRAIRGVSTQRPDEQRAFAEAEDIPFPLLSDVDLQLAAAARLPTFRAGGAVRLKRLVLVVAPDSRVLAARYPVDDIPGTVEWALHAGASTLGRPATVAAR